MTTRLNRALTASLLAFALAGTAFAADFPEPSANNKLGSVRTKIEAKQWDAAIDELRRINDTGSADWNNLMGYALRKSKTPDLAGSEKYYNQALRIDPQHLGTLSYSGELYLMKGDLPSAEKRLAALDRACAMQCPEYAELKKSIEKYKAASNKSSGSDY
jgi:opacity protein-like surface antigen